VYAYGEGRGERKVIAKKVGDIFSKKFASIHENDMLSSCLEIFEKEKPGALAVLDSKGKYKGVLALRWIIRSGLDPSTTKVETLMRSAPKLTPQDSLSKAARLMIESEIRHLPVFDGEKLLGILTDEELIHAAVMDRWGETMITRLMTEKPHVVEEDETVGGVLSLFREHGISHAPVVKNGKLVGMVSVIDFVKHLFKPEQRTMKSGFIDEKSKTLGVSVSEIMSAPVVTVTPGTVLREAEQIMHKNDVHSLVVVAEEKPIGIVTKRDLLEPLAQMDTQGKTIDVQFSAHEVRLDETQKRYITSDFESFAKRFQPLLEAGTLFVYIKTHGASPKGEQLIHIRLQLRTSKGNFFSAADGWNPDLTFHLALEHLERQVLRSKELEKDKEHAVNYLGRIRFPLSDY
jgi:predicted transcriptional regulator